MIYIYIYIAYIFTIYMYIHDIPTLSETVWRDFHCC